MTGEKSKIYFFEQTRVEHALAIVMIHQEIHSFIRARLQLRLAGEFSSDHHKSEMASEKIAETV